MFADTFRDVGSVKKRNIADIHNQNNRIDEADIFPVSMSLLKQSNAFTNTGSWSDSHKYTDLHSEMDPFEIRSKISSIMNAANTRAQRQTVVAGLQYNDMPITAQEQAIGLPLQVQEPVAPSSLRAHRVRDSPDYTIDSNLMIEQEKWKNMNGIPKQTRHQPTVIELTKNFRIDEGVNVPMDQLQNTISQMQDTWVDPKFGQFHNVARYPTINRIEPDMSFHVPQHTFQDFDKRKFNVL